MKKNERPYTICHMIPSVDGRIVTRDWKLPRAAYGQYDRTAAVFKADAWLAGRVSMAPYAAGGKAEAAAGTVPPGDFIAPHKQRTFAVALDPSGKLLFKRGFIDKDHVVVILTANAPAAHRAALRAAGVSYILAGRKKADLAAAMRKLRSAFGIRTLLLEGGGKINGSMLNAGLIDELSVLVAPVADGRVNRPSLFDAGGSAASVTGLKLLSHRSAQGGVVWLRYTVI